MMRFLLFTLFLYTTNFCSAQIITVKTQTDFDAAIANINAGNAMQLELEPGYYLLTKGIKATSPLTIIGKQATISNKCDKYTQGDAIKNQNGHYVCKLKHPIDCFGLFINNDGETIHPSESVDKVARVNLITDMILGTAGKETGIEIKIPIAENLIRLSNKTFQKGYGYFDCGWSKIIFSVEHSDDKYFYCKTLNDNNVPNFNYDLKRYKQPIRYVLYNMEMDGEGIYYDNEYIYIPNSIKEVHYLNDIKKKKTAASIKIMSDFTVTGITFDNIEDISIKNDVSKKCNIANCTFTHTLGTALNLEKSGSKDNNVATIKNCSFSDCSILTGNIVYLKTDFIGTNSITLSDCTISRYPEGDMIYKNCAGSVLADGDITIKNNIVYNSCRNLIRLKRGIILCENNIIYNTKSFNEKKDRNLSSDFGLIYCGNVFYKTPEKVYDNKNSIITIDGNLIHGSHGYYGNARGIFIDDGRGDVTCTHNVIYDTQMYSIDARYEKKFKGISSIRVNISDNLLACPYRLQTNDSTLGNNAPISSGNILLYAKENKTKNIKRDKNDIILHNINLESPTDNTKFRLSSDEINVLNKLPMWNRIKHYIIQ